MPCRSRECGCGIVSNSLQITGDGNPWQIEAGGATVGTQAQRLGATPFQGLVWHESDTGRTWLYDGSAWRIQRDPSPTDYVTYVPDTAVDSSTSASPALWLTAPDVVVPPWATAVDTIWLIAGAHVLTTSGNFSGYPRLDGVAPDVPNRMFAFLTVNQRVNLSVISHWTGLTPGATLTPTLLSASGSGGAFRFDTSSRLDIRFDWREA